MKHFLDDSIYPLPDPMVDQFCLQILPEIHHKIKWLNLELLSMERILLATNYPNLYGLGLYDLQIEKVKYFVTETLVDGNDLKINIINHMPRLNEFTFNIRSFILYQNQIDQLSNEDMQHTFKDYTDNEIISCIDYFEESKYSQCHIYSYSYKLKYYDNITNNFPGGLFKNIREISLFDEHSLEYEFFLQIAQ
ncbi:unnamed protein product [Rotaria sordida]|uniref:Uncharacterized protein n=2 Tax=Rotaria sordida TaxID=392033 RepID=A0A813PNL2_9BILA|nr:unnamed protein product [Rotaria sordida]CAF3472235.1 unnamed protein product [Rotaria sordida]